MVELSEIKLTQNNAQHAVQNRREIVAALCPTGVKRVKLVSFKL